jgi:hypothetical protein
LPATRGFITVCTKVRNDSSYYYYYYIIIIIIIIIIIKGKKVKGKDVPVLFSTEHHAKKAYCGRRVTALRIH